MVREAGDGEAGYRPPGQALQVPVRFGDMPIVTRESVAWAHQVGLEVHVWTIDDEEEMRMLLDLGVDGLITNLPARARAVIDAR